MIRKKGLSRFIITLLVLSTIYLSSCSGPQYVIGEKYHVKPLIMFRSYFKYLDVYPGGIPDDFVFEITSLNDKGYPSAYTVYIPTDEGLQSFDYNENISNETIVNGIEIQIDNKSNSGEIIYFRGDELNLAFKRDYNRRVSKIRNWPRITIDMRTFDKSAYQLVHLSLESNRISQESFYYNSNNESVLLSNKSEDYSYTKPKDFINPEDDMLTLSNFLNGIVLSYQDNNYAFNVKYVSPDGYYAEGTWSFFGSSGTFKSGFDL